MLLLVKGGLHPVDLYVFALHIYPSACLRKRSSAPNRSVYPLLLYFFCCSPAILVSSSRVFEYLLDDRSAEVVLLACLLQYPDYKPALSIYGKLAACKVREGFSPETCHSLHGPEQFPPRLLCSSAQLDEIISMCTAESG